MKRLLAILLIAAAAVVEAAAQDVSAQREAKRKLEEEIAFIDNQLKDIISRQKASTQQLTIVQKQVSNRKKLVDEADAEIRELRTRINTATAQINALQANLDTLQYYYDDLIYNAYKNRDNKVWFMYILGSENIGQGYRRFSYLGNLSESAAAQADNILQTQEQLRKEKAGLDSLVAVATATRQQRQREYNNMKADEQKSRSLVNSLNKSKNQYTKDLQAKKKQVEALNREIERILTKAVKEQKQESIDYTLAGRFEDNKGKLPWPVQGVITGKFGNHNHPVYKNIQLPTNNGVDITAARSATVRCVFDGTVKQVLVMPGYSQCVLVQHGTYYTFYCRLGKVSVKAGQKVNAGDSLGTLDVTDGSSVLHFQIWKGTDKQNPESWMRK
ncbi:MAG: peptidoglycan DD-metalloendopeptidase family protein [Bacteroidales bacterium]|nr:peptidoglycan DD-metalloendopeptidase family protein [Bacteroidales bacterium]MBR3527408.1 peptidoglycan DD-metalloendopeptidase family protein [Bacteroidales bacterium]MCR5828162.1 peptidoglycan DD-metalloendopeptidase family protein [Bacteroidales bacterium]